jgi:dipeptidase
MACTTILVGKNASYDGSTLIARNEDSANGQWCPKKFVVVEPKDQPRHYQSVLSHVQIELPDNPQRYTAMPEAIEGHGIWAAAGINESNVAITATETITSNARVLGADPLVELIEAQGKPGEAGYSAERPGGIGEEDIVTLVLPYIRTAREGIRRLGGLIERYGTYEMNGIAISDVNEIWWLETIGGHHWIAKRVPDDAYVTMPNQFGIDCFDIKDALGAGTEHLACSDLYDFVEDNHLDLSTGGSFSARVAFGSHTDEDHVYNTPRAWSIQRWLNPHSCRWDGPGADFTPESDDIPWARIPEHKIAVEDIKHVLSLHFQGTPFDPYDQRRPGRGPHEHHAPYRPIGINRTSHLSVLQLRPYVGESCRAIEWVAFGSNVFNALAPFFANINRTPEYVACTSSKVSTDSLYWNSRLIAALADAHYQDCAGSIEAYQQYVASKGHEIINKTDLRVEGEELDFEEASPVLELANDAVASMLQKQTSKLLGDVLDVSSMHMRNAYGRSDA